MPVENTKAETQATFDAFLAKVPDAPSSAHAAAPEADAEAPLAERDEKGKFAKRAPEAPAPETADPSPASPPDAKTPSTDGPDLESVKAALRDGDLDTLAELLGEDPALYDEKTPKWAAGKRREAKIKAERDSVTAKAEAIVQRWSPV